ncbi:MAG: retropepsin-like aspartic protease [Acidobacteriaceae bacterium]
MRQLLFSLFGVAVTLAGAHGQSERISNKPLVELNYRAVGQLIYLPVQVNGSDPLWFCFDSGAPNSILDSASAQKLNIKAQSSGVIHGAGHGEVSASDAGEVSFTIGGLTTRVPHANIVDLSKVPGQVAENGLLGAEFLEQYVVRIDSVRHTIAFYDPKTFIYRGDGKPLPLELTNSRLYIRVGLATKPGELLDRTLRVDTGSEDSIDDDTIRGAAKLQKTTVGNGLGTSYEDVSGVYDTVKVGPFVFRNVWGPAGGVPIIGMEMMRRFTLTFDTSSGLLYLEPNASLNEPFPAPN